MPDSITKSSSFFMGVGFKYWDYMVIDIIKWLFVVGLFYAAIIVFVSYYKNQLYSGVIVKYGAYLKWFIKSLTSIFIVCFSMAFLDGALFYRGNLIIGFCMILLIAFNYTWKAICVFCLSNKSNYNIFICIFIVFEVVSIYKPHITRYNPFSWGMMARCELICEEGFNIWISVVFYVVTCCFLYGVFRYKSIKRQG